MEQRELGLAEMMSRLDPLFESYPLKYLKRVPSRRVTSEDMPCVLLLEHEDNIIQRSSRSFTGYPLKRIFNPIVEVWDFAPENGGDVQALRTEAMKLLLVSNGVLLEGVAIREAKSVGPFNFGEVGILGMSITFEMIYTDDGT